MTTTKLIEVTPLAASKLGEVLRDQGGEGSLLRIMVMPGGHGGLQYMLGVEKEPAENDVVIEAENVRVVVDPDSVALVEGSEIDYVEGLMRSGFVISNPNAAGGCGCGAAAVVVAAGAAVGVVAAGAAVGVAEEAVAVVAAGAAVAVAKVAAVAAEAAAVTENNQTKSTTDRASASRPVSFIALRDTPASRSPCDGRPVTCPSPNAQAQEPLG